MVRMGGAEGRELVRRAAVLEAAAGVHVRQDHSLLGAEDLRGLGHETDAAKGDHVSVGLGRLARQIEAIADEVRQVLDLGLLVVMGENYGFALALQPVDLGEEIEALKAGGLETHFCPFAARLRSASWIASSYGVDRSR